MCPEPGEDVGLLPAPQPQVCNPPGDSGSRRGQGGTLPGRGLPGSRPHCSWRTSAFLDEPLHLQGEIEASLRAVLCQSREGGGVRSLAEFGFVPQTRLLMHRRLVLRGSHQRNPTGQPIAMARASPCWSGGGPTTHVCLHSAAGGAQAPLQGRVLLLSHAWGLTHVQACGGASAVAGLAELSDLPQGRGRGGVGVGLGAGLKSFGPWAFTASCLDGGCSEGLLHCGRAVSGVSIWDCERL